MFQKKYNNIIKKYSDNKYTVKNKGYFLHVIDNLTPSSTLELRN